MKFFALLTVAFLLLAPNLLFAQEGIEVRQVDAVIVEMLHELDSESGVGNYIFNVETEYGEMFEVNTSDSYLAGVGFDLNEGDRVYLQVVDAAEGTQVYFEDINREMSLLWIAIIFSVIAVLVGRWRGVLSLVGLCLTILVLFGFLFPAILAGRDPVISTVLASIVILAVNMHISHGIKKQTFLAFLGTTAGLSLVIIFSVLFVKIASLSGLAGEEATLLFWESAGVQLPVGILTAGIILGAVGVLDDVAITQSEVVGELLIANPNITKRELFAKAMRIGRHHIASTVNTLVLVYAGAALPVFLLYIYGDHSVQAFFGNELIGEEIVRTLAGTCALVLTVPISTWFATLAPRVVDSKQKCH